MITNKGKFFLGLVLLALFAVVLVLMFLPLFGGKNALKYADALYNSISKGSAYYIPSVREASRPFRGTAVSALLALDDTDRAGRAASLFRQGGAMASPAEGQLQIEGDLGDILANCLADAELMYRNDAAAIEAKYGRGARQVLHDWWVSLKALDKSLKKQKQFDAAETVATVKKKAVETSYNYYGVEPQKIGDRLGVVVFSLIFYVVYTLWYGFAIMFLFEGWGLVLGH